MVEIEKSDPEFIMSRWHNLSDSDISDSDHDKFDELDDEQVLKLFASEEEIDASFSGFSTPQVQSGTETVPIPDKPEVTRKMQMAATQAAKSPEKAVPRKGKSVKNSDKGKAPKRKTSETNKESVELPSGNGTTINPKKRKVQTKTIKPKARKSESDSAELIKSLFQGLSDTLKSTLNGNKQKSEHRPNINDRVRAIIESNANGQNSDQGEESEYHGYNEHNVENGNFSIFSDDDNDNDQSESSSDSNEFDYELPRIFDGDERYGDKVCESISKVCDNICRKKTDVSAMVNDLKIPSNCRSLVVPPVNPEIWQFLDRKPKSSDLGLQSLQRLLAYGMIPVITLAGVLKTKKPDIKLMRESVSKAMTILCNAHFELSVKRKVMLKPYIDKKFHQLCNKNEEIGVNLFGDEIGKKLTQINEVNKINKNITGRNQFSNRGGRGRYPYQSHGRFLGRRGFSRGQGSQRTPYSNRGYMGQGRGYSQKKFKY